MTPAWVEVLIRLAQFGCGLALFGLPAFTAYRGAAWKAAGRTGTTFQAALIAKVVLFDAMLSLAAANRFVLVPRLECQNLLTASALSGLKISVGVETAMGLLVLLAVAVMGPIAPITGG